MSVARSSAPAVLGTTCTPDSAWTARPGGSDTGGGLQLREQLLRRGLQLHDDHLLEKEVIGAVEKCARRRRCP